MAIGEICTQDGAILDVRRRGQTVAMVVRKLGVLSVPVAAALCALGTERGRGPSLAEGRAWGASRRGRAMVMALSSWCEVR